MGGMTGTEPRARVGTSGWDKPTWRGHFYPRGLVQHRRLEYAANCLATLEINTTFYGFSRPSSFRKWCAATPEDFAFAIKAHNEATHTQRLRNPAENVARFLASGVLEFGEKMGPILWQTPPSLAFDREVVKAFLAVLPHSVADARRLVARYDGAIDQIAPEVPDRPIRHALEVRDESFSAPDFLDLLREHDVAAVMTNSPGWPRFREVTADFVYVRLHGDAHHHPNGYDDATLDEWATNINGWLRGERTPDGRGRDVFVYFDNPDNSGIRSPLDAMLLQERLDGPGPGRAHGAGPTIQPPLWDE